MCYGPNSSLEIANETIGKDMGRGTEKFETRNNH